MIGTSNAPAHESEAFKPSSFATRRAARAERGELAPRPRRLVSLGVAERWLEGFGPNRRGQLARVELLVDRDDMSQKYQRHLPYGSIEPLMAVQSDPPPEDLGVIRADGISSGAFPSALATPPPEIIT
jgi:hypothetical protein